MYVIIKTMGISELIEKISQYDKEADLDFLKKVYEFSLSAHQGQVRISGEPFILHPLEVANILADLHLDVITIAAAILHDTVEDTKASILEIKEKFGEEAALLVDGVTKLTVISQSKENIEDLNLTIEEDQAVNLRKIFLAMAKDIRVILIKLADRLHNLRTLSSLPINKQKFIARETLEIFAPIASRLGLWHIKWQLEDLAFSYMESSIYKDLADKLVKRRIERESVVQETIKIIQEKLKELKVEARIEGRPKHIYSIYQKMNAKGKDFSEIYDLFAIRIITNTVEDSYAALGIIHSLWMPLKDRIKDYIAMPKANNYRSLHTTVYGPGNESLEIQIRTREMHQINEYGIAAHWAYKEKEKGFNLKKEILPWISRILDWQEDSKNAKDYIRNLKLDLLNSQVFVFTPHSDVIDLPVGSTPIDFAYRIHTDVGHRCVGAKVNAKIVPLDYQLQNADIVEIITSKHSNPSLDWLKICKATHSKNKIRQWFKKERREENIHLGKEILEREFKKNHLEEYLKNNQLFQKIADKLTFHTLEDLYASIGYGETTLTQIFNKIKEELPKGEEEGLFLIKKSKKNKGRYIQAIKVKGIDNVLVRFSKCCLPILGDEIKGYITLGKGVSIHRADCPNFQALSQHSKERLIEVSWEKDFQGVFYGVEVEVEAADRPGLLSEIMGVISELRINASYCRAFIQKEKAVVKLSLDINNRNQLDTAFQRIGKLKNVIQVKRLINATNN